MRARRVLAGAALIAACGALAAPAATPGVVRVTPGSRPGRAIPRSFLGLSVEYPSLAPYARAPGVTRLLQALGRAQRSPVALRVGGGSADHTWWSPAGPAPPGARTVLDPAWLRTLAAFARRMGSPVTLTLNLASASPVEALAFARAARAALPPGALRALEIGNEPDIYARRERTGAGRLGPPAFPGLTRFTPRDYVAAAGRDLATLSAGLRPAPALVVGGFAGQAWNRTVPALVRRGATGASVHAYPLYGCSARGRRAATATALLRGGAARVARDVRRALRTDALAPAAVRVAELNSVACGGLHGTSDVPAAAPWAVDALFRLARLGVAGVDVHTFVGARYAPFALARDGVRPRALYAGLLLFARAAPAGARLLAVHAAGPPSLRVYATTTPGATRVVAVDASRRRPVSLAVAAPPGTRRATVQGLSGRARSLPAPFRLTLRPASVDLVTFTR